MAAEPPAATRAAARGRPRRRNGGELIKSYVHEAEQRRAACRFARTGSPAPCLASQRGPHASKSGRPRPAAPVDPRVPANTCTESRRTNDVPTRPSSNQRDADDATPALLRGFFAGRRVHRRRQLSLEPDMLPAAMSAAVEATHTKPAFTFTRRKLQMESVSVQAAVAAASGTPCGPDSVHTRAPATPGATLSSPSTLAVTTSQQLGQRPKASNLAAKLDAMLRSSPWMRRKVVVQHQSQGRTLRGLHKASSLRASANTSASPSPATPTVTLQLPRSAAGSPSPRSGGRGPKVSHTVSRYRRVRHNNGYGANDPIPSDVEKRIMAAFRRIVRLWRERKRRAEQAALSIVTGGGSSVPMSSAPGNATTGPGTRTDSKVRREIDAQSYNVVSILSRRMISEVPALKFFDEGESNTSGSSSVVPVAAFSTTDEGDVALASPEDAPRPEKTPLPPTLGDMMAASSFDGGLQPLRPRRATPKGVCYTLDSAGCRCIKMQAGAAQREAGAASLPHQNLLKKTPELTVERAMAKSLRRKMTRRVKAKRMAIGRLTDDFHKHRQELTTKLGAQLALRQAQGEKMFSKRLALLLSDDAQFPPHMAAKELSLARMRFKKLNLLASCQTLALLGKVLQHIETAGESSGLEASSGELHFLELFRCAVEGDHALTPLLADGIRGQFSAEQRQKPAVAELLEMLERGVQAG